MYCDINDHGSGFSPLSLSPALWLDALDSSTVILISGAVSQWSDKSGNARHATQNTAANRPSYNLSSNSLVSDGINDIMYLGGATQALSGTSAFTIFSVNANTGGTGGRTLISTGSDGISTFYAHNYYYSPQGGMKWISAWGSANGKSLSTQDADSSTHISVSQYNGNSHTTFINGLQGTIANYSGSNLNGINTLFGTDPVVNNYMAGTTNEIIIYNNALSITNLQKIEGYLAWKWRLVSLLPAGHPYKTQAP